MDKINSIIGDVTKSPKHDIFINVKSGKNRDNLFSEITNLMDKPVVPISIVLNRDNTYTAFSAIDFILGRIRNNLNENKILVEKPEKPDELEICQDSGFSQVDYLNFMDSARSMMKLSRSKLPNIRIVLLIDNIDCLFIKEEKSNLVDNIPIKFLNSLLQSDMGNNISAIFRGRLPISKISKHTIYNLFRNFKYFSE